MRTPALLPAPVSKLSPLLAGRAFFIACIAQSLVATVALAGNPGAESPQSLRQLIDTQVRAGWDRENLKGEAQADDATFLRRVYLDLVGTIPTHDEARQFLEDKDAGKRATLVERLLADSRFAQQQATLWDLLLFSRNPPNSEATRKRDGFRQWLTAKFSANVPVDRWVRELLLAEEDGSELFYVQFQNKPEDLTEAFSRIFLGTQLQCARCHDHPNADLEQKDFYGMAGFFVRLVTLPQATEGTGDKQTKRYRIGEKATGEVLFAGNMKELKPGNKGEPVKPKFLGGDPLDEPPPPKDFKEPEVKTGTKSLPKPAFSRKEKLAEWTTAATNPFFARAVVNRTWSQFMGRGIVHPVDNLGAGNQPTLPALLDALAQEFVAHQFDLKWLIREIVNSQTYQLGSSGTARDALPKHFERARIRPLSAEEIMAALQVACGHDPAEKGSDSATPEYFVRYFGTPMNGHGDFQGSLSEHLFLNNSSNVRAFLRRKNGNLADTVLNSQEPWEQRVDRMFLSVLTRLPTGSEREKFVTYLQRDPGPGADPDAVIEEALWVLVNLSEFRFNH